MLRENTIEKVVAEIQGLKATEKIETSGEEAGESIVGQNEGLERREVAERGVQWTREVECREVEGSKATSEGGEGEASPDREGGIPVG